MSRAPGVLFVFYRTPVKDVYGGEKSTIATARALEERGIGTHFLVTADDALAAEIRAAGLRVDIVPVGNPFDGFRASSALDKARRIGEVLKVNREVARLVRRHGIRVVDASLLPSVMVSWLGARIGGARVVYHVRTASRDQRTRPIEEVAMALSDRTLAVSPSLRQQLLTGTRGWLRPYVAKRLDVVANGFDFDAIDRFAESHSAEEARRELGPTRDRPSALLVGGITPDKGQLRFIERVLPAIARAVPGFLVTCVGGEKNMAYAEDCRRAVARLGLADHVRFAGYLPQREVFLHYLACDLAVLPSEREGLPRCAIEAQAFARPIVATAVVGSVDAIRDGGTGYLVKNDRIEDMAPGIIKLSGDASLRLQLGQAGAAHVRQLFRLEENARAMAQVIESLSRSS